MTVFNAQLILAQTFEEMTGFKVPMAINAATYHRYNLSFATSGVAIRNHRRFQVSSKSRVVGDMDGRDDDVVLDPASDRRETRFVNDHQQQEDGLSKQKLTFCADIHSTDRYFKQKDGGERQKRPLAQALTTQILNAKRKTNVKTEMPKTHGQQTPTWWQARLLRKAPIRKKAKTSTQISTTK